MSSICTPNSTIVLITTSTTMKPCDYYTQAKENMNGTFAKIEDEIFDYTFFKDKFQPEYESDPDNPEVMKKIIKN